MADVSSAASQATAVKKGGLALLVIDQQVDFHPGGSLAIPTANEDAARITAFIQKHSTQLSQVVMTLDSHQRYHIAHGVFWENAQGESPSPFTLIPSSEIANGVWKPRNPALTEYVLAYTQSLEKSGKFTLCIWPEHCIIGTPGHNIVANVHGAALDWVQQSLQQIQYVMKGSNSLTEHYSALKAEFELDYDPATRYSLPSGQFYHRTRR
jgi:nicotinamidase/pyrazinamidase